MTCSLKRFIFVSIISQFAHTGNQFRCPWCKEQWLLQNWSWTLSKTSGQCQRGPAGPFETSAIMLFSWQADNFIREVSQGVFKWKLCIRGANAFKNLLTGIKSFDLEMENSKAGRIWGTLSLIDSVVLPSSYSLG